MAQRLGDVLHHFMPELEANASQPGPLPIVAVPLAERDAVRAAFTWNLAVEIGRLGGHATIVAPRHTVETSLWPAADRRGLGAELVLAEVRDIAGLARAACDVAVERTAEAREHGGVVLTCLSPAWLQKASDARPLLRRALLFSSPDRRDLRQAYALAKRLLTAAPASAVGVTIHGVTSIEAARKAFLSLAAATERHLGRPLCSYGLLMDELDVYRSILERAPIGVVRPQAPAARALRDVARLLLDDLTEQSA